MTLKELRQQRSTKATRGKAALDEHNTLVAKADRTAEDDAKLASLSAELDTLEAEVADLDAKIAAEEAAARRGALFSTGARASAFGAGRTVNEADPERTFGFRNMADFGRAVYQASKPGSSQIDPRLAALPANYNQGGGTSGEGYLVPPEYSDRVWELVFDQTDLVSLTDPEPTASNHTQITKDETTPWGAAGVQAYWRVEGGQMTASKLITKGAQQPLHELYAFVVATDELLSDAPRLNNRLTKKSADAIRWKASDSIAWGDGVGKPHGFMNSGALVSQAKESGQAADTIVSKNIAKMYSRLLGGGGPGTFWMANPDTLPEIMVLVIGDKPIWTPPTEGFKQAPGGFLLGKPVLFTEHADTLGDLGDIVLVDPAGYAASVKQGGGIDFAQSMHLFFDFGAQAFRWTFRLGGQPILSAPVTPPRSSSTKSHFVALAERA